MFDKLFSKRSKELQLTLSLLASGIIFAQDQTTIFEKSKGTPIRYTISPLKKAYEDREKALLKISSNYYVDRSLGFEIRMPKKGDVDIQIIKEIIAHMPKFVPSTLKLMAFIDSSGDDIINSVLGYMAAGYHYDHQIFIKVKAQDIATVIAHELAHELKSILLADALNKLNEEWPKGHSEGAYSQVKQDIDKLEKLIALKLEDMSTKDNTRINHINSLHAIRDQNDAFKRKQMSELQKTQKNKDDLFLKTMSDLRATQVTQNNLNREAIAKLDASLRADKKHMNDLDTMTKQLEVQRKKLSNDNSADSQLRLRKNFEDMRTFLKDSEETRVAHNAKVAQRNALDEKRVSDYNKISADLKALDDSRISNWNAIVDQFQKLDVIRVNEFNSRNERVNFEDKSRLAEFDKAHAERQSLINQSNSMSKPTNWITHYASRSFTEDVAETIAYILREPENYALRLRGPHGDVFMTKLQLCKKYDLISPRAANIVVEFMNTNRL